MGAYTRSLATSHGPVIGFKGASFRPPSFLAKTAEGQSDKDLTGAGQEAE